MKNLIIIVLVFNGLIGTALGQKSRLKHEMVFVEGGIFQMGSNSVASQESPGHSVTLSSFNIGKYEVTQAQWKAVMGTNHSNFSGCRECPVESVSWHEVQEFIKKLNVLTEKNYRLPTEAEWEFASRGGNRSMGFTYSGSNDLTSVGWYLENSERKTHPVGLKLANELGIYDMSGNVSEWCSDWFNVYSNDSETNPAGSITGKERIQRGGCWICFSEMCSVASRLGNLPEKGSFNNGFRIVLP